MVLMALVPGGLLLLCAYFLGRTVLVKRRASSGASMARSLTELRLRDVWSEVQATLAFSQPPSHSHS